MDCKLKAKVQKMPHNTKPFKKLDDDANDGR